MPTRGHTRTHTLYIYIYIYIYIYVSFLKLRTPSPLATQRWKMHSYFVAYFNTIEAPIYLFVAKDFYNSKYHSAPCHTATRLRHCVALSFSQINLPDRNPIDWDMLDQQVRVVELPLWKLHPLISCHRIGVETFRSIAQSMLKPFYGHIWDYYLHKQVVIMFRLISVYSFMCVKWYIDCLFSTSVVKGGWKQIRKSKENDNPRYTKQYFRTVCIKREVGERRTKREGEKRRDRRWQREAGKEGQK